MKKQLLLFKGARCKQTLNDLDTKIFARYSQLFVAIKRTTSGTLCIMKIL